MHAAELHAPCARGPSVRARSAAERRALFARCLWQSFTSYGLLPVSHHAPLWGLGRCCACRPWLCRDLPGRAGGEARRAHAAGFGSWRAAGAFLPAYAVVLRAAVAALCGVDWPGGRALCCSRARLLSLMLGSMLLGFLGSERGPLWQRQWQCVWSEGERLLAAQLWPLQLHPRGVGEP